MVWKAFTLSLAKDARTYSGEKTASSISGAEIGQLMQKDEIRTLPNPIHKNELKIDERLKCKSRNYKALRGKHRQNTWWHKSKQDPLWPTS